MLFRRSVVMFLLFVCMPAMGQTVIETTAPSIIRAPIHYPSAAVSSREEGVVLVMAEVDTSGRATLARVDKSSGFADLDAAALRSISLWSFRPAMRGGKPVEQWINAPISFRLKHAQQVSEPRLSPVAITGDVLYLVGSLIWVVGFVWSVVLAKRKSILWLSFMVALWIVTYPLFVAMNWSAAKRNLVVVSIGIAGC